MEDRGIWLAVTALTFSGAGLILTYLRLGNRELKEKVRELRLEIDKHEHRIAKLTDYLNAKEEEVERLTRQNLELLMDKFREKKDE